jgi:hypothetical protein
VNSNSGGLIGDIHQQLAVQAHGVETDTAAMGLD